MRSLHLVEIGLALAVTLGVKIAFGPSAASGSAHRNSEAPVSDFLRQQGFSIEPALTDTDPPMVSAGRGDCRLRIAEVSPFGWHRHVLAQLTGNGERTAFVFQGAVFESQPYWRTAIDHNWRRLLAYGGLEIPRHPVLGVVASGSCALGELPWVELAELP